MKDTHVKVAVALEVGLALCVVSLCGMSMFWAIQAVEAPWWAIVIAMGLPAGACARLVEQAQYKNWSLTVREWHEALVDRADQAVTWLSSRSDA